MIFFAINTQAKDVGDVPTIFYEPPVHGNGSYYNDDYMIDDSFISPRPGHVEHIPLAPRPPVVLAPPTSGVRPPRDPGRQPSSSAFQPVNEGGQAGDFTDVSEKPRCVIRFGRCAQGPAQNTQKPSNGNR